MEFKDVLGSNWLLTGLAPGGPGGLPVRWHQHHRLPPCGSQQPSCHGGRQVLTTMAGFAPFGPGGLQIR